MARIISDGKNFPNDNPRISTIIAILLVLFAVAVPRLMLIGGFPATDEGVYAYFAQSFHASLAAGRGLPDTGPLAFYPLLLSWVFAFDVNPLIALRLIDMLLAVVAGYALYRVIEVETRSRLGGLLICVLFLFTMNQPVFIQYGFKNSMHAAYVPLFAALWLGLTASMHARAQRWIIIGILLSVSALLRETFLPLIAMGTLAVLISRGFRPFFQLMLGAAGAGGLILGLILAARGDWAALLESYQNSAKIYSAMQNQRTELFFNSGAQFIQESTIAIVMAGAGLVITLVRLFCRNSVTSWPKLVFWLAATLIPLIEPASKIGFPYHFSVCLPGMAGLAALGWRNLCDGGAKALRLACGVAAIAVFSMLLPRTAQLWGNWPQSREVLASFQAEQWPEIFTDKSNYLLAADTIRKAAPPGGTVAISGYMLTLYPLTGFLPPKPELANLTRAIIELDLSESRLREALLRCPPNVVMTTSRTDWPGSSEILAAVRATGVYEEIAEIPMTNDRAYGGFGGLIFRATKQFSCGG